MARSLRHNFAWTFAGSAAFAASQWIVLAVITKLGSVRDAGDWTLALALTAPVFILTQLKLRTVQATDRRGENTWSEFLALRILGVTVALIAVGALIAIGYRGDTGLLVALTGVAKAFDSLSDLAYGREQQRDEMHRIARSLLAKGIAGALAGSLAFWATRSTAWAALAIAAVNAFGLAWDLGRVAATLERGAFAPRWKASRQWTLFRRVLPLGVVTAIGSLQINIPRYFLEGHASREALGIFGALSYVLIAGSMLITALGQAALPRLSQLHHDGDRAQFSRQLRRLLVAGYAFGALTIAACVVAGEPVLRLLYSDEVAREADVLVWLAVASTLLWGYQILGTALDAMRRFGVQPWIHATSTIAIAVTAWLLVPGHGMLGATWAMLVGYALDTVLYLIAVAVPLLRSHRD